MKHTFLLAVLFWGIAAFAGAGNNHHSVSPRVVECITVHPQVIKADSVAPVKRKTGDAVKKGMAITGLSLSVASLVALLVAGSAGIILAVAGIVLCSLALIGQYRKGVLKSTKRIASIGQTLGGLFLFLGIIKGWIIK